MLNGNFDENRFLQNNDHLQFVEIFQLAAPQGASQGASHLPAF